MTADKPAQHMRPTSTPPPAAIRCPKCGHADVRLFRYLEDIQNWRRCLQSALGRLIVDGRYETGQGYDDGDNPRLQCHAIDASDRECLGEFPIPEGVELEFE